MAFRDTNSIFGLPKNSPFQVGRSDNDTAQNIEQGVLLPWAPDAQASWVYYDVAVMSVLDSGIVVHHRLPQVNRGTDTLATCYIDDPSLDKLTGLGVNLKCKDQYQDIVQRMGHARYWFRIWGQALRIGQQVPIPGLKTIGGVPAIPYDRNPQWAWNRISPGGNYSGTILWHAQWSLWYTTLVPPNSNTVPAADPSAHISSGAPIPTGFQAPFTVPDDNAQASGGPSLPIPYQPGK